MNFLYAISGWPWVLAAAVPAGIFALYFLKLKRKPLRVPSTYLWKKSIEDLHVNSLWQRLRRSILLFLQLLIAALVIFALLRPTLEASKRERHLILLIDNSASMSATDVKPSRLESAKRKGLEIIDQMRAGDAAMVIAFSDAATVLCSYTENSAALKQAIQSIEPTARTTDLREALVIASALANPQKMGEGEADPIPANLYLLSDGKFPEVSDVPLGKLALEYIAVGNSAKNVGLVALSARPNETQPDRLDVFARVRNYDSQPATVTAELFVDGKQIDLQRKEIPASGEQPMVFRLMTRESAVLSVKLDATDDFTLDNQGWVLLEPPRPVRAVVIGDDNSVLRTVLQTEALRKLCNVRFAPRTVADTDFASLVAGVKKAAINGGADQGPLPPGAPGDYDLMIFDRCVPKSMPACNTFFVGALPPTIEEKPSIVAAPAILNWNSSHSVLRFLNLDDVTILEARAVPLPRGADNLIETDRGSALFALPRGVHTDLVQTFALLDDKGNWKTDWPLKLSFPLFFMNVVRSLGGVEAQQKQSYRAGEPYAVRFDETVTAPAVKSPRGRSSPLRRAPDGRFEYLDTDEPGIYTVETGATPRRFAVNLFDDAESAIEPAEKVQVGAVEVSDTSAQLAGYRELWRPLAIVALIVLLVEWYIYNRRVYI